MSFIKKSSWSLAAVVAKAAGNLLTNKLFAVYFGAAGVSLLSHFQNLISLLTQVPNDGINRGVMKYLADEQLTEREKQNFLASGLAFGGLIFLLVFFVLLSMEEVFFSEFIFHLSGPVFYGLFFLATLLFLINLFLQSILLAAQQVRAYAVYNILGILAMLSVLYLVLGDWKLDYALFAFLFGQSAGLVLFLGRVIRKGMVRREHFETSKAGFQALSHFVLMAASVLVFGKLVDFIVRFQLIELFGLDRTGEWQAVVKISDLYIMLFISTVGTVFYPQIAALIHRPVQMKQYLWKVFRLVGPATMLGLLVVYVIREELLVLLFSEELLDAVIYFPLQLAGDWFLLMSFLLTYILSAQRRTTAFLASQAFSAFLYLLFIFLFQDSYGLEALPLAHALRAGGYFTLLLILNRKLLVV